jgi:hypothetical protein
MLIVGGFSAPVLLMACLFFTSAEVAISIATTVVVAAASLSFRARGRARAILKGDCSNVGPAVRYVGWYGTFQEFIFTNNEFAGLFVAANRRKNMSDIRKIR